MSAWVIVPLASLVCYSALLALNIRRGLQDKVNLWFSLYLATMIVWSFGSFLSHLERPGIDTLLWNRVLSAGSTAMPFVFFGFVQFFLHKDRKLLRVFSLFYFAAIQTANILGLVIESAYVSKGMLINSYGPAVLAPSISWPLYIGLSAWDLIAEYRKTRDSAYRNRLKYLLAVIITIFCGTMTNTTRLSVYPIDLGFNVISAGLIAYAILRYQLLDLSVVIRKSVLYSIPTILIGALYFLVIQYAWRLYDTFTNQQATLVSFLVAILIALVTQPVRDKAQLFIDRIFFREKHDIGLMLQRVNRTAASVLDINALTEMILKEINANLHVTRSAFFLKSTGGNDFQISAQEGMAADPAMRLREDHPIVQWLARNDQVLSRIDIETTPQFLALWGQELKDLASLGAELFIPVKAKQVLVGILAIGPKRSEETFSQEDYETLTALASQTAVAIENARLFAEARQRTAEMTHLNAAIQAELSERLRAEEALKESEERYRRLAENAPDLIYRYRIDPDPRWEFISPAIDAMTGHSPDEFYAHPELAFQITHPEDRGLMWETLQGKPAAGPVVLRLVRKDGSIVWTEQHIVQIYDPGGRLIAVEGIARDITRRKQDEEELANRVRQLEKHNREINILNEMGDVLQACQNQAEAYPVITKYLGLLFPDETGRLYVLDSGRAQVVTAAAWGDETISLDAFDPEDCWALRRGKPHLVDRSETALTCRHIHYDEISAHLCMPMMAQGEALGLLTLAVPLTRPADQCDPLETKQQLAMTVAEHIALSLSNLNLTDTLRQQAIRDPLTNLYNRRYLEETLERELARAMRKNSSLGIIFIDIDHFKLFNDRMGHDTGDRVLREVGHFLKTHIRKEDIACRYGGEEFILILPDTSLEAVCQRAEEVRLGAKQLSIQLSDGDSLGDITLSLGVSVFPTNGQTVSRLLRSADAALYQAKQQGRDRYVVAAPLTPPVNPAPPDRPAPFPE